MAAGWDKKSLSEGMGHGVPTGRSVTRPLAKTLGAFAGGVAVGAASAVATTGTALVSGLAGGLIEAATDENLNVRGKILDGLGGIPGDVITALGQGVGTLAMTPIKAAAATLEGEPSSSGIKAGADYASKAVVVAANPKTMIG